MSENEHLNQDNAANTNADTSSENPQAHQVSDDANKAVETAAGNIDNQGTGGQTSAESATESAVAAEDAGTGKAAATEDAAPKEEVSAPAADEVQIPPHFEKIPQEKLKRARRIKRILIVIIVLLVLVLLGTGAATVYYYFNYGESTATVDTNPIEIEAETEVMDRGTTEAIDMPNLAAMFGQTPENVLATLGTDYTITKTEIVSESSDTADSGEEGSAGTTDTQIANESTTNAAVKQIVTINYAPKEQTSTVGSTQVQNIYLSLNEAGAIIEIYFVSSMSLLDYPIAAFGELVGTKESFVSTLNSAGVPVPSDIAYTVPTEEDYTEYVDETASTLMVRKQTVTMKGTLASEQPPNVFEITYTYDYGVTGIEDTPDKQPTQRMLYIKLS